MVKIYPYLFFIAAAAIGIWAFVGLLSAFLQAGPMRLIKKYFKTASGKGNPTDKGPDQP